MLYSKLDEDYVVWRYWCECGEATDILEITDIEGLMSVAVYNNPNKSIWCRLKDAAKVLFGKSICYNEVVLCEKDRGELAQVIKAHPS